jgi:GNAT superfamily N-acetyltransferase
MTRADVDAVLACWLALAEEGHAADPRFGATSGARAPYRSELLDLFRAFHPFAPAWVAEVDGAVVGWIHAAIVPTLPWLAQPPTARITDLYVAPGHRRSGVGRALVAAVTGAAGSAGFSWTEVGTLALDARATTFWRSLGFTDWKVVLLRA